LPQVVNTLQAASGIFLRSPLAANASATAVLGSRVRPARLARPPCQHRCHYRCRAPRASRQVPPSAWPASPRRPSTARGAGRRPARERRRCRCRCRRRRPPGPVTERQSCHMLDADPCVRVMQGIHKAAGRPHCRCLPRLSQRPPRHRYLAGLWGCEILLVLASLAWQHALLSPPPRLRRLRQWRCASTAEAKQVRGHAAMLCKGAREPSRRAETRAARALSR